MSNFSILITFLVVGLFLITLCTDIITQVIKKLTYDKIPTNIVCVIISLILAVFVCFIGSAIGIYVISWYHIVIAIIFGFFAAFIGMNGFDKFVQTIEQYKSILELRNIKNELPSESSEESQNNE